MTNSQTLEALTFDLILEVYELAARLKAIEQLSRSDNYTAAHELMVAADASSIKIMELSKIIQTVAERNGRGAFGGSVDALLQQLPRNLGDSTKVQLEAFEEALGLPARATLHTLRTAASTGIETSQPGNLWRIAFTIGLATIAAAGVGAPLAALATNQAIGQKVLEEAVITFASVAIVEAGIVVIMDRSQGNPSNPAPPWSANIRDNGPSVEPSGRVLDSTGPVIGTNTDHLLVAQRGRHSPKEQAADDRTIARYKRYKRRMAALQDEDDPEIPNPWKAAEARRVNPEPEQPAPPSAAEQYNPKRPSPGGGRSGPSVGGPG